MQRKMTRMDVYVQKTYNLVDFIYEVIKNSFFFWLYLLKGFGVITLFASIKALTAVSLDVIHQKRKNTFRNFKENYQNTDKSRFSSLFTFFLLAYLSFAVLAPLPEKWEGSVLYGIKYAGIFLIGVILLLMFTRPVFDLLFPDLQWSIPVQVYALLKNSPWTILLLIGMIVSLWFGLQNLIFLIGFTPGFLGMLSAYTGEKITDRLMQTKKL